MRASRRVLEKRGFERVPADGQDILVSYILSAWHGSAVGYLGCS
jgi:hypothetical protein